MKNATPPQIATRRIRLWIFTLVTSVPLTVWMARTIAANDTPLLDAAIVGLFFVLTTWTALWFWIAAAGFRQAWLRGPGGSDFVSRIAAGGDGEVDAPGRTAILAPVYNEDAAEVFARIRAMQQSLAATGAGDAFDFFVLSDTTNPDVWLEELWHWRQLQSEPSGGNVFYRRRSRNLRRKAGNIQDFCERWGARYRLMVVLDADSLIDGRVLVEMAHRMEEDPQLGLLQTPTLPLGDRSLLSRCQQFAAKLCRPLLAEGLEWFSGDGGNYWGHNAIVRTTAFTRHCGLAKLPGEAPLGGEILSHDFVEAALMHRAGYRVRLACDLTDSYEQCPTTLPEFAQRDQRWCQGNMQHAKLVTAPRMRLANRFHFATGLMAFISSPLWLSFLLLSALAWKLNSADPVGALQLATEALNAPGAVGLFAIVIAMLVAPRVFGAVLAAREPGGLSNYGGPVRLVGSLLLEFVISVALAPIMMAFHTLFVISTLAGQTVHWNSQNRSDAGVSWRLAWATHRGQTIAGIATVAVLAAFLPAALLWVSPVYLGLILSMPICVALSSARIGEWFKQRGFLRIPEEIKRPPIVDAFEKARKHVLTLASPPRAEIFRRFIEDPLLLRSHLEALRMTGQSETARATLAEELVEHISTGQWATVTAGQKRAVLLDPAMLTRLHRLVWRTSPPSERTSYQTTA